MSDITLEQARAAAADRSKPACHRCGCYPCICIVMTAVKEHPPIFCVKTEEQRLADELAEYLG